jgi:hypothetical protein
MKEKQGRDWEALGVFLLKLLELLRPRYYNRIAWLMVLSGLAMMSAPLWELLLESVLKQKLDITIPGISSPSWGLVVCVLGLIYHMANTGFYEYIKANQLRDRLTSERAHDIEIFKKLDLALAEAQVRDFVELLQTDHSYWLHAAGAFHKFERMCARTENQYLTDAVSAAITRFSGSWGVLGGFIAQKFFVYPRSQTAENIRLCMTPELNMDRDGTGALEQSRKYDELSAQLDDHCSRLLGEYNSYRSQVKRQLLV